jgi:hypothetical protein
MTFYEDALARDYAALPMVEAVALGGSQAGPFAEPASDYDLYIYSTTDVPIAAREAIARRRSPAPETNNRIWEPGDEWTEPTGQRVDVMFRDLPWITDQLARVLDRHEASTGYTTAFWFNVKTSRCLFDRNGAFHALQQKAAQPYPEPLRRNIIAKNHPILRSTQSSYAYQIERALQRNDAISVNHRVAALLASFFDILFAFNRQPHPGEKRLLRWADAICPRRPQNMFELIPQLLRDDAHASPAPLPTLHRLLDELDALLRTDQLV